MVDKAVGAKRERAKKQRAGKDGVAKGTHTGGPVAHVITAKRLEEEKGEPLTPDELFLWLHTRKHDGMNFINDRCKELQERFEGLRQPNQTPGTISEAIDHLQAFYKACGGIMSGGRVFGLGTAAIEYYGDRFPIGRTSSSRVGDCVANYENRITMQSIQERLNAFNADRTRVLEHLQRMDGRQEGLEKSVAALRSEDHSNENQEILERLTYLETHMGPMLRQLQHVINNLQTEECELDT